MYNQLINHDPENGKIGDCFRTCVANYLGIHPSEVPALNSMDQSCSDSVKDWLNNRGLGLFWISFADNYMDGEPWIHWAEKIKNLDQPYILTGRNSEGSPNHSCLYKNGELLHDPCGGSGLNLPAEEDGDLIWCMYLIVPLMEVIEL